MNRAQGFGISLFLLGLLLILGASALANSTTTYEDITNQKERKDNQIIAYSVCGFLLTGTGSIIIAIGTTSHKPNGEVKKEGKP